MRLLLLRRFDIQIGIFFLTNRIFRIARAFYVIVFRLLCNTDIAYVSVSVCLCLFVYFDRTTSLYSRMVLVRVWQTPFAINNHRYTNIRHGRVRNFARGRWEEVASKIEDFCIYWIVWQMWQELCAYSKIFHYLIS